MVASLSEMSNISVIVFDLYMNHPTLIVPLDSNVISADDIFPAIFIAVCRDISSASLMAASSESSSSSLSSTFSLKSIKT